MSPAIFNGRNLLVELDMLNNRLTQLEGECLGMRVALGALRMTHPDWDAYVAKFDELKKRADTLDMKPGARMGFDSFTRGARVK